jgi:hypothetical protein
MSKLQKIFIMFLHTMVKHNPKKTIEKKLIIFSLYYGNLEYICMKKNTCHDILKNENILLK